MVRLLWQVCQNPDFRKVMSETHARLLSRIYRHLAAPAARLPSDWVADQVGRLDRSEGDIDTLMGRIAHIRTWTYIAHRPEWLAESSHWQERARAIEDKLSDALHDRITQRFVDRRSAFLVRRLASSGELLASVSRDGEVKVEGHYVGRLDGFRFVPDTHANLGAQKTLLAAANRVLRGEIAARARELARAPDAEFELAQDGAVAWRGRRGRPPPAGRERASPEGRGAARRFPRGQSARHGAAAAGPLRRRIRSQRGLGALFRARDAALAGPARGLVFQLAEALGSLPAREVAPLRATLTASDRKTLARLGVRLGTETVYCDPLLKPKAARLRGLLWAVRSGAAVPGTPAGVTVARDPAIGEEAYAAMGYRVIGPRALRVDRLERLAAAARALARQGPFAATAALAAIAEASLADLEAMLTALGYRAAAAGEDDMRRFHVRRADERAGAAKPRRPRPQPAPADGPFAKLKELRLAR